MCRIKKGWENFFDNTFVYVQNQVTHENDESTKRIRNKNIATLHPLLFHQWVVGRPVLSGVNNHSLAVKQGIKINGSFETQAFLPLTTFKRAKQMLF